MQFQYLRVDSWKPTFEWVESSLECADKINSYHEDYPKYVKATDAVLCRSLGWINIPSFYLRSVHSLIFTDKSFAGKWREVDVRVGNHTPPKLSSVDDLMDELHYSYENIRDIDNLIEWYKDFETIHPFQDGNGRVGGVIVAQHAHRLYPDKGWLASNQ